jgi:hypothetical protein
LRSDLFDAKKSVHIKLKKDLHTALRERLFKHNLTMQDIFQDLAESLVADSSRCEKLIQKIVTKKLKKILEGRTPHKESKKMILGELDSDTLYSLLEEKEKNLNNEE